MASYQTRKGFWREAIAIHGSITVHVLPHVVTFGLIASCTCGIAWLLRWLFQVRIGLDAAPFGFAGAGLGLLLVIRMNAGYDRWWEARKLWGGIVNQSRSLVISAMAYGPKNMEWQERLVRWAAAFPHVAQLSLRNERPSSGLADSVGSESASRLASSDHMPSFVALMLGDLLREACERFEMDKFAFLRLDRERALLMDHLGACERILTTPLPRIYSITIRRFVLLFLLFVPLLLLQYLEAGLYIPLVTMLIAYPLLSLDQIGVELENPFSTNNLSHLPLDQIAATIERNLLGILKVRQADAVAATPEATTTK